MINASACRPMHKPVTRGQAAEAAFHSISPATFAGLQFEHRDAHFDWRMLHGIDVDAVVRLTDVRAIEDNLDTLQHGNLDGERGLSVKNCTQLFRLLQLAIEYITHLRNAHALLLTCYERAAAAAQRWAQAATAYLQLGDAFIEECRRMSAMSMQRLEQVDASRAELEEQDRQYNAALDQLEVEDQQARYFHFRKQRAELNWQQVHAIDLDELVAHANTTDLDKVMHNITYGSILGEDAEELTPHHFAQLIPVAQCGLDYVLFQANVTGALLEQSMQRLQVACANIPALTTATQQLHDRITMFVIEAHAVAQGQHQLGRHTGQAGPESLPAALTHSLHHRQQGWAMAGAFSPAFHPSLHPLPMRVGSFPAPPISLAPSNAPPGSRPNTDGRAVEQTTGGSPSQHLYEDMLLSAAALGGTGAKGLLSPWELQARTAELHFKVDELEKDLRMERHKTEDIRRILADIRDRVVSSGGKGSNPQYPLQGQLSDLPEPTCNLARSQSGPGKAASLPVEGWDSGLSGPSSPYAPAGQTAAAAKLYSDEEMQRGGEQWRRPPHDQGNPERQAGGRKGPRRSQPGERPLSSDGSQVVPGPWGHHTPGQLSDGSGTERGPDRRTTPTRGKGPVAAQTRGNRLPAGPGHARPGHRSSPSSGHLFTELTRHGSLSSGATEVTADAEGPALRTMPSALSSYPAEGTSSNMLIAAVAASRPPLPSRKVMHQQ